MIVPNYNSNVYPLNDFDTDDNDGSSISMEKLYPALVQCFAIIICGYIAGLMKIISNAETKGLNTFVGTFALPSLIFLSLVELNWETVNWNFLLSILVSKAIVFFIVGIISLLVARPLNYGRAGLFAIFCTQSNDFAIGYPIVLALYEKTHPEYASYIYLLAPISLAILNPIGYVLMEITKMKEKSLVEAIENEQVHRVITPPCPQATSNQPHNQKQKKIKVIIKTAESIFFNPILLMTILGVIGGIAFPNGLPEIISNVVKVLGNSFSAPALFLLGLRMVGQGQTLQGSGFLIPGILILMKLLVLPLVTRQTVNILNAGANFSDTTDLSTFGFLYGTFPAAPGVFVIATQYNIDVELIATSMLACTFISAPLMFISAKMISLTSLNPNDFLNELSQFAFDISIVAIIACIWVLALFGITKKYKRIPHKVTCCIIVSQLISSIGVLMWSTIGNTRDWIMYLQFCLFSIGQNSSRLWSAILAIVLLFLQCRSLCFVLKLWPLLIGISWGISIILTSILLIFDAKNITPTDKRNPNFQYGNAQAAVSIFLLVMSFIVIVGCLVLHQRYKKRHEKYLTLSKDLSAETDNETIITSLSPQSNGDRTLLTSRSDVNFTINTTRVRRFSGPSGDVHEQSNEIASNSSKPQNGCGLNSKDCCSAVSQINQANVIDIEDLVNAGCVSGDENDENLCSSGRLCNSQFNFGGSSRQSCQTLIQKYQDNIREGLEPIECNETNDDNQTLKHTVLLIFLLCSMFVSLALSVWTLIMEGMSGIYVELTFLDGFLNFGQSIIVLAVFITDTGELLNPIIKYWRELWYGANVLKLPNWDELNLETKLICEQFTTHHLDNCRKSIARDRRWRIKVYKKVFYGNEFVDWLIELGLSRDRIEATHYAKRLIEGRVLRHSAMMEV